MAGRDAGRDRHDLARAPGVRLGARHRPRERGPQRAAALQLGALPGGARLRRDGVDQAGPVPLGGRALPLPLRESVGAAVPGPAPAHLDSRRHVAQHGGVVGQAPVPVHHARHRARAHTAVVPLLRPVRCGARLRGRVPAPRLSVQGARGRDRGAGRAGRAPLRRGSVQPVPGGQPGQRQELHPEPAGPDVAHPAPADRQHLRRRGARQGPHQRGRHGQAGRHQRLLRAADREDVHHQRHAEDGHPQDPHGARDAAPGLDLLLGRRRGDGPQRRDALPAPHGRGSHSRLPRDGQGAGPARALRHRPGHQQEARPEAGRAVRQDRG